MPQVKKRIRKYIFSPGMTQKDILTSPLPTMARASRLNPRQDFHSIFQYQEKRQRHRPEHFPGNRQTA